MTLTVNDLDVLNGICYIIYNCFSLWYTVWRACMINARSYFCMYINACDVYEENERMLFSPTVSESDEHWSKMAFWACMCRWAWLSHKALCANKGKHHTLQLTPPPPPPLLYPMRCKPTPSLWSLKNIRINKQHKGGRSKEQERENVNSPYHFIILPFSTFQNEKKCKKQTETEKDR